ncbi:hypothetical protein AAFF_G00254480 [Aldrovandia affinis]|uniref:SH3 domain-containing protein n=1 Tax=Aldrovandia affinis TaxID=143900 RepID=A0AAD7RF92_9TELE|nr:hypothetical protein AAFF_G00254480 [Aldrovandia affinis]
MNTNLAYRNSISSVSNSSLTSLGSTENLLSTTEPLLSSTLLSTTLLSSTLLSTTPLSTTSLCFNNNSLYGPRLEMLQQIANRVQRDCVAGEDKLALARSALQSDAKRLESGIQFQNEAEIAGYLLECENFLRQQVVDIQVLLDGKFYLADQLVQRVSKLRDDLLALRSECSSVYSKGRTLTTEQTKMMISGITQSLNSGFSSNLNAGLPPALASTMTPAGPGSAFSSGLTQTCLPPSLAPVAAPGLQAGGLQAYMGGVDPGALQQLKFMQIRKPLLKSSMLDPNMTEEEVSMNFVQDLLNWVEEMQVQLDRGEWGSDLPSVEMHLENHKSMHKAIEEFQISLKEAKVSEIQMTPSLKHGYSEKLGKLEAQYGKLQNCSRNRQKNLESLHDLVSRATQELIWLNEKEEEEVAFDWSDRNTSVSKKRDYHAELMRELDEKEGAIKSVQDKAEQLLGGNHPARLTIEAYRAAMQTQWNWILQLCSCVEQHLRENSVYFEFFTDAKESQDYLKNLHDAIQRKYSCDRSSSLHKLEDLVQESMDEKEQLLQYRGTVAGLVNRAKSIIQLKPRNPDSPVRTSIPVRAICDYRQIEITIYKEDECVLANNSHRAKWKVISPSGNEAMVPSVCFTVPPPNKEAFDTASRIEQQYQNVLALWHRSHINMKSVVSWHYLMTDVKAIRNASVSSVKTMLPGEHQQVLSNLQSHLEDFLEDSEESEVFSMGDRAQLEREVEACKEYYEELLRSAEREEHEESVYNLFISEVRNFRMRLEGHEEHLIRQIRTPLDRDDLQESVQRIIVQEKTQAELDRLKEDLETIKEKCETFVSQASASLIAPTLSAELNVLIHSMSQVYSMSSIYLEKLKTVNLVVKHSQTAEALVKLYEAKLCEEDAVNADTQAIEILMSTLKQWRSEIDEKREVFHDLEDELQKARTISDRMFKTHNERDFDLDWHKEKADQLGDRWHSVHSQIENRLRDLEGIGKSLKYYRDAYSSLDEWNLEMEENQLKMQENQPEDSKALAELLNQQKVLVCEIEQKQSRIEECQKYSEQYSAAVKDYELQLMTYMAMVDSQHKSPVKRRRMQSSSDAILQEFMDLRTRYTALVTLMTQYVKFASETLKRTEEEERRKASERAEYISWTETVELQRTTGEEEITRLQQQVTELEDMLTEKQQQQEKLEGELQAVLTEKQQQQEKLEGELQAVLTEKQQLQENLNRDLQAMLIEKHQLQEKLGGELEAVVQGKAVAEQELGHLRQLFQHSEAKRLALEESLRMLKKNIEESTAARRKLEEHLRRKDSDVQDLEEHSRTLERELKAKEGAEAQLLSQVRIMEMDLAQNELSITREVAVTQSAFANSVQRRGTDVDAVALQKEQSEVFQHKFEELAMGKMRAETEIKTLKSELNSVLVQKNITEEKAQRFKDLLEEANNRLKKFQMDMESDRSSNRQKSEELRQEVTELKKSVYIFQDQINSLQRDKSTLEQKALFYMTEVEGLKEQLKINQGKLFQVNSMEKETIHKIRCMEEELINKQTEGDKLRFQVSELTRANVKLDNEIRNLKVSAESQQQEKTVSEQKLKSQKSEMESLKELLKKAKEEFALKAKSEQGIHVKARNMEVELEKSNQVVSQLKKRVEELNNVHVENERSMKNVKMELDKAMIEMEMNLRKEVSNLQMDKKVVDQKLVTLKAELDELNSALKRTKDELQKEAQEGKKHQSKVKELEGELQRSRQTLKEVSSSSNKSTLSFNQEIANAQKERSVALDKARSLTSEVALLKQKLEQTQEEVQQKQKETLASQLRSQNLEEQVENCKHMLDDLKDKLELQKKGHENQLQLVQAEIEQKLALQESSVKMEYDKKSREHLYSTETAERESKYLQQEIEQLKSFNQEALKLKQEAQQQLDVLRMKVDQGEKDNNMISNELIGAKTRIADLEMEKVKLTGSITQADNSCKEISNNNVRLKQTLAETERKLAVGERESRSLKEQVASYIKEVKSLQENVLKLEVAVSSESKKVKDLECQKNHQCPKDDELIQLKTELLVAKEMVASHKEVQHKLMEELQRMKMSLETMNMEKGRAMEGLSTVRQEQVNVCKQMEVQQTQSRAQEQAIKNTENSCTVKTSKVITRKSYVSMSEEKHSGNEQIAESSNSVSSHHKDTQVAETSFSSPSLNDGNTASGVGQIEASDPFQFEGLKGAVSIRQLVEAKLLDVDTLCKLKSGQIAMDEVRASLAGFIGKTSAIAGIYSESSKKKISFMDAAEKGFIAQIYAIEFLEAQAATGQIIDCVTGKTYSVQEALEKGIVGEELREKLLESEKAVTGYVHGSRTLSVFQAMESRILDRHKGKKIIEAQMATGGLVDPQSGIRLPLNVALEKGLINKTTLQTLYDPVSNPKCFHNPDTGQKAYYGELLKMCVYDIDGHVFLLPFGSRHLSNISLDRPSRLWVVSSSSGAEMSTFEAYIAKLIDRNTYLSLSQQESAWEETTMIGSGGGVTHILTDHRSGRQLCIEHCLILKILTKEELEKYRAGLLRITELADLLISRRSVSEDPHSPIAGLWDFTLKHRFSVLKGHQQNLVDRLTAIRLLEAQACTGGICDPLLGEKFTVTEAAQRGLLDETMVRQLQQCEHAYRGVVHPQTAVLLSVGQAMQQALFPRDMGFRCLEFQAQTGGLVHPETQARFSVEEATHCGLINEATATHLNDEKLHNKNLTCPKTKRKISYKEALEKGVYDCHTGLRLLGATKSHNKSIEEEKKEHGDKVSKLLGWMSSVKTSLSKEDKGLKEGKHSPETASKPQVSMEELATKKEQIAEALRTTQLMLTKHSDKMTEDEKQETKEQLKSLHQAYSELSQQCADQTPTAEQEYQTIEGILEVGSGAVYSVCRSVQGGLVDQTTGLSLLEAQLVTTGLILPEFRMCLDLDDAFKHNLVDKSTYQQLQDLNDANRCILDTQYASEPLPVITAAKDGAVSESLAIKVIEIQLATGGLRVTYTGDVLNLEKAFQCGLIPPSLFVRILERQNTWKDLIDPSTAEKVSLIQLVQRSFVQEETGLRLLPVRRGREGTICLKSGREISILRAVHEGLIDRETMFRLLGAQLFAGGIVDPRTEQKLTIEEALAEGLIDQDTASGVLSHQAQNGGIVNPHNGKRLTVDEAVQCDLMSSSSALLVLERQKCFMGFVWPQSGEILTVTTSLQHKIITNQLAYKLLSNRQKIAAFYIPENSEVIGIDSATREGLIDRCTADVLKKIEMPDIFPDIDKLNHSKPPHSASREKLDTSNVEN